jgi:zinc transport system ATP-binding protein
MNNNVVLEVKNLSVKYQENEALKDVSFTIYDKDYLGIIGPNGGGKTSLLKSILGLIKFDGDIKIYNMPPKKATQYIGYVPQISEVDKSSPMTVCEVVLTGRTNSKIKMFHKYLDSDKLLVDESLKKVGIYHLKDRLIKNLSGGEFQRMLIARALVIEPKILLLDEPTASVDHNSREQIYTLLKKLNESMTIILVTHDLMAISSYVKNLACLNGNLVYHGNPDLNEHVIESLYGCQIDLLAHGAAHRVLGIHEGNA